MLIPKSEFVGLENIVHLCTGGESPSLKTHQDRMAQFFADKVLGEGARARLEDTLDRCKGKMGRLLNVSGSEITFLSSSTEGINLVAHALDWQAGDNVVVCDVEFPSDILPWTWFEKQGVELRIVRHRGWKIHLDDIAAQIDSRTRVVAASYVSYFTGQRLPLADLSALVRSSQALLLLDATHAAGAVPVQANLADILVCSCYKWLLGVHGAAVFYWNRERVPDLKPPFLGWNSGTSLGGWEDPTGLTLRPDADRFLPGNPSFISLYVLENALDYLLKLNPQTLESYILELSGMVWEGLQEDGWQVMTPKLPAERAGNICFMSNQIGAVTQALEDQNVLIWGGYGGVGRVRVSTHLYNEADDVAQLLVALKRLPEGR
ncbi:MAG: aminotransferase class V-fold PLP-dependent enzyme [Chloroflexota bacterium]